MAGLMPPWVLELLFTLIMLQSVYFELTKKGDDILPKGSPVATRLELGGDCPARRGVALHYAVTKLAGGGAIRRTAGAYRVNYDENSD
jgi:hypothetical protein